MAVLPGTTVAQAPDLAAAAPPKIVLLPVRAQVARVGLVKGEEVSDWSAAARANLEAAIEELAARSSEFVPTALPVVSAGERSAIDEYIAVANLATTQFGGFLWSGGAGVQRATADRVLGPSLSFLSDRTGADYALGAFAFQLEQSKSVAALGSIASLVPLAGGDVFALPPVTFSYVTMFIADLATGELRWFDVESGYEVVGFNFSDLRDPESARKMVGKLLEKYPDEKSAEDGTAARPARPTRPVSNRQGEFALRAPADWRVSDHDNTVRATRDGRVLNEINVELRDHGRSFLTIGRRTTRYSTPQQLADWLVAELEQQQLPEFQVIGVSTDAQLVGKPAFRVRYGYRLPAIVGGARMELVAIGTAVPNGVLIARLAAPQLAYFARALPAFEETVQSIVLKR